MVMRRPHRTRRTPLEAQQERDAEVAAAAGSSSSSKVIPPPPFDWQQASQQYTAAVGSAVAAATAAATTSPTSKPPPSRRKNRGKDAASTKEQGLKCQQNYSSKIRTATTAATPAVTVPKPSLEPIDQEMDALMERYYDDIYSQRFSGNHVVYAVTSRPGAFQLMAPVFLSTSKEIWQILLIVLFA